MDGIVLRHADQREAERDGDAVHAIEDQADRGEAGETRRQQGQAAEYGEHEASIGQPQQRDQT